MHEKVLRAEEATLGPDDSNTLASTGNVAMAYHNLGRIDQAMRLYEESSMSHLNPPGAPKFPPVRDSIPALDASPSDR